MISEAAKPYVNSRLKAMSTSIVMSSTRKTIAAKVVSPIAIAISDRSSRVLVEALMNAASAGIPFAIVSL